MSFSQLLSAGRRLFVLAFSVALVGCATVQPEIGWKLETAKSTKPTGGAVKVAVLMTEMTPPNTYFPGAACLLCLAFAEGANSALTTHVKTLKVDDLVPLRKSVVESLRKQGVDAVEVTELIKLDGLPKRTGAEGASDRDFTSIKTKYQTDQVMVLNFSMVGMHRSYASYIPQGAPYGVVQGETYLVDATSSKYLWYQKVDVKETAQGTWDEPPKFPGLTNAYYQAIEKAKDLVSRWLGAK